MAQAAYIRGLPSLRRTVNRKPPAGVPRNQQLKAMPEEYILCRVGIGNHSLDPDEYQVLNAPDGGSIFVFACAVCGTEVAKYRDRHGFVKRGNTYKHPKDYLMQEGGKLTDEEKAVLFLKLRGKK